MEQHRGARLWPRTIIYVRSRRLDSFDLRAGLAAHWPLRAIVQVGAFSARLRSRAPTTSRTSALKWRQGGPTLLRIACPVDISLIVHRNSFCSKLGPRAQVRAPHGQPAEWLARRPPSPRIENMHTERGNRNFQFRRTNFATTIRILLGSMFLCAVGVSWQASMPKEEEEENGKNMHSSGDASNWKRLGPVHSTAKCPPMATRKTFVSAHEAAPPRLASSPPNMHAMETERREACMCVSECDLHSSSFVQRKY